MRSLVLTVVGLSVAALAVAQHRQGTYDSLGGFGNVLYPGTGHAPPNPPGGINGPNFANRLGNVVAGRPAFIAPPPANHQQHRKTVIVPYPVYYGGYVDQSAYGQQYQDQSQLPPIINTNGSPSVMINPGYVPVQANPRIYEEPEESSMRMYQNRSTPYADMQASSPRSRNANDDKPTIYLIAFRDHSIVQALGYWMEGSNLHYVSAEHSVNQASMDLIDRDLSQRLNDERAVEFKLPVAAR
jgi:hypothetical protein